MRESDDGLVRAAGGVVWRRAATGDGLEVLLVHRPRYDDWTLPKGKLDGAESFEAAALREVEEETGLRCVLGPEIAGATYRDNRGRDKVVRYWAMSPVGGQFVPGDEVDEVCWLSTDEALDMLSYERDREVLASLNLQPQGSR